MSISDDSPSMALVVRKDLGLSAGKMAVQCAHAEFRAPWPHARPIPD